jgi:hypothetical protein
MAQQFYERTPLELTSFPASLQNNIKPEAPPPMKMMAARGLLPAPPDMQVRVLYQLVFDPDEQVRNEARKGLGALPVNILSAAVKADQPAGVLDWVAELRLKNEEILEAIVVHKNVDDLTVARVATACSTKLCDLIGQNEVRILRCVAILEQLYQNPNARMAMVDKLVDLAHRNGVSLAGLPGVQQALENGLSEASEVSAEGIDDALFASLLANEIEKAVDEDLAYAEREEQLKNMTRAERERFEQEEAEREAKKEEEQTTSLHGAIGKMSIAQKIRLATIGSREAVGILVKDANRLVHMAAINNPRLQYSDIKKMASNKSMPDGVIRFIAQNRDWTRHYDVIVSLVNNPKTPLDKAMAFMNTLRTNDLRQLQSNRNVSQQLARQAKIMMSKRMGG